MTRDTFFRIALPSLVYVAIGWWIGKELIAIPSFQTFKVLNIVGLSYDLLGVALLSRVVLSSEKIVKLVLAVVAEQFLGLIVVGGLGFILCSYFGPEGPSKSRLQSYSLYAFMYFIIPTSMFISHAVVGIEIKLPWSEEMRAKVFGGFFLVVGIVIQLYAAILDLHT